MCWTITARGFEFNLTLRSRVLTDSPAFGTRGAWPYRPYQVGVRVWCVVVATWTHRAVDVRIRVALTKAYADSRTETVVWVPPVATMMPTGGTMPAVTPVAGSVPAVTWLGVMDATSVEAYLTVASVLRETITRRDSNAD